MLQFIVSEEGLADVKAQIYDINSAELADDYYFISCTVALMFLNSAGVDTVIVDMQAHTLPGGYHLIVCAMSAEQYPCPVPLPFTLTAGQLPVTYKGWELVKYNEDAGVMHNGAQLQFATLLARKLGK
ncbi:hypothetical protein [Dasania marina]|uniref:hypothetical protein n=1 Tax=Dasania marina TaxID=471499 RepID=UPI000375B9FB|nr:hypothetical protein [Dasania marina]